MTWIKTECGNYINPALANELFVSTNGVRLWFSDTNSETLRQFESRVDAQAFADWLMPQIVGDIYGQFIIDAMAYQLPANAGPAVPDGDPFEDLSPNEIDFAQSVGQL